MGVSRTNGLAKRRGLLATAALVVGITAAACAPVDQTPPPPGCPTEAPDAVTSTVLNRTNADRAANGLGSVYWNARLACLAKDWSDNLARTGQLVHRDLGATIRSPGFEGYSGLAENILVGPANMDGDTMQNAWMGSASHRSNILGNYDTIGVAWTRSPDGRTWATANFGRH